MTEIADAVFEIIESEKVSPTTWVVRGLSYKLVSVGDILITSAIDVTGHSPFVRVKEIATYGRKVEQLGEGYTAELILEGDISQLLQQSTHLFDPKSRK
jgi:hypothetical protein